MKAEILARQKITQTKKALGPAATETGCNMKEKMLYSSIAVSRHRHGSRLFNHRKG